MEKDIKFTGNLEGKEVILENGKLEFDLDPDLDFKGFYFTLITSCPFCKEEVVFYVAFKEEAHDSDFGTKCSCGKWLDTVYPVDEVEEFSEKVGFKYGMKFEKWLGRGKFKYIWYDEKNEEYVIGKVYDYFEVK